MMIIPYCCLFNSTPCRKSFPLCRIYASVNRASNGSDNSLSQNRHRPLHQPRGKTSVKLDLKFKKKNISSVKMHSKTPSVKWRPFCSERDEWTNDNPVCSHSIMSVPDTCRSRVPLAAFLLVQIPWLWLCFFLQHSYPDPPPKYSVINLLWPSMISQT